MKLVESSFDGFTRDEINLSAFKLLEELNKSESYENPYIIDSKYIFSKKLSKFHYYKTYNTKSQMKNCENKNQYNHSTNVSNKSIKRLELEVTDMNGNFAKNLPQKCTKFLLHKPSLNYNKLDLNKLHSSLNQTLKTSIVKETNQQHDKNNIQETECPQLFKNKIYEPSDKSQLKEYNIPKRKIAQTSVEENNFINRLALSLNNINETHKKNFYESMVSIKGFQNSS